MVEIWQLKTHLLSMEKLLPLFPSDSPYNRLATTAFEDAKVQIKQFCDEFVVLLTLLFRFGLLPSDFFDHVVVIVVNEP